MLKKRIKLSAYSLKLWSSVGRRRAVGAFTNAELGYLNVIRPSGTHDLQGFTRNALRDVDKESDVKNKVRFSAGGF